MDHQNPKGAKRSWQQDGIAFHESTGLFRAQDVRRVLGDPRDKMESPKQPVDAMSNYRPKPVDKKVG